MTTPTDRRHVAVLATKSIVFTLVTLLATLALAATIRNSSGGGEEFRADFSDVTSLNRGDDIRMAGVKVGSVRDIEVGDDNLARVTFTVDPAVTVPEGTQLELRFRNLVGQRYIAMEPPVSGSGGEIEAGHTFPVSETAPALDLTLLFNGFQPLFRLLDPEDVNTLSGQIVAVFQGDGASVDTLLASAGRLTTTLAERDAVIGDLIDSLGSVLETVSTRSAQLDATIVTLQQLVTGLAQDRDTIGRTLDGLGALSVSVADLLEQGRAPLAESIVGLGDLAGNLSDSEEVLDRVLTNLPPKLDALGRTGSYGSWLNFYVCSIQGSIPLPEGYRGDLGAEPDAARCYA
ncbi:MCE family protein [Nocardioides alkalitolerans]|uniref:MCE family protein n=1 Tax=Nocardioides alkalitolerans TaxID=281714 RepID=UPI000423F169|nr:MlaD family protein [Nocardioides alkalitolerans]